MSALPTKREQFIRQIQLMLGADMVDLELDPDHYHTAITLSVDKIRQRSDGALEEQDLFLTLQPDTNEYTLPQEVQEVRRLYRRGVGAYSNGGANFDPIDGAFHNSLMLQANQSGGLATWDFYNQFLETAERVFASQYNFLFYNSTKTLKLVNKPRAQEDVVIRCWTTKHEDALLEDPYSGPWVRSHAMALCKHMLGQARSKYPGGFPGPGGAVTLNGDALMSEAMNEIEKLDEELKQLVTAGDGYGFIVG